MAGEGQLTGLLREFAGLLVADFPVQGIIDHLVKRIVDVLPVTSAGVTLIQPHAAPQYLAASDESAMRFEQLQTELGEGPCVVAFQTGEAVLISNLRAEPRFPAFVAGAIEAGLAAVFTFPLRDGTRRLGALDLYRDRPGPLDPATTEAAQTLADVASAYLINARTRSDLQDLSDRSREQALHDALTGLPNRTLLLERLEHAVRRSRRSGTLTAVLFADLDRFKSVNDRFGHSVGDQLLVAAADRLKGLLRPGDTLARMSGDEFVILCEDLDDAARAGMIAARIGDAMSEPFVLANDTVKISVSVGIAFSGRGDQLPEHLLHDADIAMYQAKRQGGARHHVIGPQEKHLAANRETLARELHGAWTRGELRTAYLPIVGAEDQQVTGVEALLRWDHPARGVVAPVVFVPLAERSGLICDVGRWVLRAACADMRRWPSSPRLQVSVNVSARQLMAPDYSSSVAAALAETETDPALVMLEVTEAIFVTDAARALVVLRELKHLGVVLALDDFGTGYSSINHLRRFPIDVVKIDKDFVADLDRDPASEAIAAVMIELAHMLGMTVVAEGVETTAQHARLASLGCDSYQGYHFSVPTSAAGIAALLAKMGSDR